MKRARSLDEDHALVAAKKLGDEASSFVVGLFCFGVRESFFFTFLPLLLERNLVMLLRKHGKEEDAEALLRGELKELNLSQCGIGDDEAVIVAAFIKVDDTVEVVYLGVNPIGPRGAKAIADALKHNKKVWRLDLDSNHIGDQGAGLLINALSNNVSITVLYVSTDNIARESEATIKYLTETRNKTLIPAAARRASLFLIAARCATPIADAGNFAIFPQRDCSLDCHGRVGDPNDPKWIDGTSSAKLYMESVPQSESEQTDWCSVQ